MPRGVVCDHRLLHAGWGGWALLRWVGPVSRSRDVEHQIQASLRPKRSRADDRVGSDVYVELPVSVALVLVSR